MDSQVDVHTVLVRARNLIERVGWVQGDLGEANRGYCVHGAINAAMSGRAISTGEDIITNFAARDALGLGGGLANIRFNNAPDRTKEQVLAAFDKAIAQTAPPPADPLAGAVELVDEPEMVA